MPRAGGVRWTNSLARYGEDRPVARLGRTTVTIVRSLYGWQFVVETRAVTCTSNRCYDAQATAKACGVALAKRLGR